MDAKNAKQLAEKEKLEFVDVKFSDLFGQWQHLTLPVSYMKFIERETVPFDGSSIRGFKDINESDMYLHLDYSTAIADPFSPSSISVVCDVYDPYHKMYYNRDPRVIAKKAEDYLKNSGFGDVAYFGPEAEFFIFDDLRFSQNENSGFYSVDSEEGIWNSGAEGKNGRNLAYKPRYKEGYFPTLPHDSIHDVRTEMVQMMMRCGIKIERHHHEVATGGQCEINFKFDSLKKSADNMMLYKYLVRNVARKNNKIATFMPKPLFNDNGSGMHCHQSIWKDGKNIFAGEMYGGLSQTALYYIGGLLRHARALAALLSPTTNSYKRLVPGFEAPVNLVYSLGNRSAAIRIPLVEAENESAKRIEYRPPDPAANPYLSFAAMLLAGLDGIKNKIDPGSPINENIYHLPPEKAARIMKLPSSLEDALNELECDHDFLLQGNVFTKDVVETWIDYKRKKEIEPIKMRPHPWEFHLYHDV